MELDSLNKQKTELCYNFTEQLMKLINTCIYKNKTNSLILLKERVEFVKKIDREPIMMYVGPTLFFYRDYIMNKNADFFVKYDFSSETPKELNDKFNIDGIIVTIKNIWTTLSEDERKYIWNIITSMLRGYALYVQNDKLIKKYD